MPLAAGEKLGPYEIQSALGAGGMGEVYRARDTRLDRTVAIKILASHLSSSPELKQRFEREARAISSLNHTHICQLYDVGSQNGTDFLVMEFLEGETLAERLRKGGLPLNEILRIGSEVAEALETAHKSGIIHRDLKPGNIMLTKPGAKLMDFGLAKPAAMGASASGSAPLLSAVKTASGPSPLSPLTTSGSIVGTIQYMSPEQIEGKEADARSDIFALGAVLYEMATGKRAFEGKSQISVASAILEKDPEPISAAKPLTPAAFEHVVRRALEKSPDDRWQSANDIRGELRWIAAGGPAASPTLPTTLRWQAWLAWGVAAAAVFVAMIFGTLYLQSLHKPELSVHSYLLPPPKTSFAMGEEGAGPPLLSPDGTRIAFVARSEDGRNMLWIQALDSGVAKQLEGTEGASYQFWSADSKNLGFFADGKLKIIDASGGPPQALCDATNGRGGAWNRDGVILFTASTTGGLSRISAAGGAPEPFTTSDAKELSHRWPQFLPDGKHYIYYSRAIDPESSALYAASLDSKERKFLVKSDSGGIYAAPGYLLYVNQGVLLAQPFDSTSLTLTGAARPLADHVAVNVNTWLGILSASTNGVLLYQKGTLAVGSQVVWYDRSGQRGGTVLPDDAEHFAPRLSPDGKKLAVGIEMNGIINIWVVDLERNTKTRITFGTLNNSVPVWSPDGKTLFYGYSRPDASDPYGHIYSIAADGTGAPEKVLASPEILEVPFSVSSDGRFLVYMRHDMSSNKSSTQCWVLPLFGDRKPFLFAGNQQFQFIGPMISPDGKWVSYSSDQTGRQEIYIRPFPAGDGQWQISTSGGMGAAWRADGKELFFLQGSQLMAADVTERGASLQLGTPHQLFAANTVQATSGAYTVTPDGKKFIVNEIPAQVNSEPVSLVTNWTADLQK